MKRILIGLTVGVSFAFVIVSSTARDLDGRYADSSLHDWFNHLASGRGLCCSMADGEAVADPDSRRDSCCPCVRQERPTSEG